MNNFSGIEEITVYLLLSYNLLFCKWIEEETNLLTFL